MISGTSLHETDFGSARIRHQLCLPSYFVSEERETRTACSRLLVEVETCNASTTRRPCLRQLCCEQSHLPQSRLYIWDCYPPCRCCPPHLSHSPRSSPSTSSTRISLRHYNSRPPLKSKMGNYEQNHASIDDPTAWVPYRYYPNLPAAAIFAVLFGATTIAHSFFMWRRRTWYFTPFIIGGCCTFPYNPNVDLPELWLISPCAVQSNVQAMSVEQSRRKTSGHLALSSCKASSFSSLQHYSRHPSTSCWAE